MLFYDLYYLFIIYSKSILSKNDCNFLHNKNKYIEIVNKITK